MDNPLLLQKGDPSRAPLFLIHDAGGGIYNYHKLHDIGRPFYAISNPWQRNGQRWEGGMRAMVDEYVRLIRGLRGKGDILVGGNYPPSCKSR
jgi:thioesterase domain-containing protein